MNYERRIQMNSKLLTSNITKNQLYEEYISESLLDLGVKANRKGFIYIKEAIKIYPEMICYTERAVDKYQKIW